MLRVYTTGCLLLCREASTSVRSLVSKGVSKHHSSPFLMRQRLQQRRTLSTTPATETSAAASASSASGPSSGIGGSKYFLFYGLIGVTACLGVWQTRRYLWKIELIKAAEANLKKDSRDLTGLSSGNAMAAILNENVDGKFVVSGEFDYKNEILLGPRSAPSNTVSKQAQGMATNALGYFVITPFVPSVGCATSSSSSSSTTTTTTTTTTTASKSNDSDHANYTILVNRGWVAKEIVDNSSNTSVMLNRPIGVVKFSALVQDFEKKTTFSPSNPISASAGSFLRLIWLEKETIANYLGIDSNSNKSSDSNNSSRKMVFIEQIQDFVASSSVTYPVPKALSSYINHYVTPETHLAYAFSWFALSFAGMVMTRNMLKKKTIKIRGRF